MDALDHLDPAARAGLAEHVSRLKHDLGKYVAFQIRWLPPDASLEDRRGALAADLLCTRRGPDGEQDATSLWRAFRAGLVGEQELGPGVRVDLSDDAAVRRIDAAMTEIDAVSALLRAGEADEGAVDRGMDAALRVAEAARDLFTRVRRSRGG